MARQINVVRNGKESIFDFSRLDRAKLYGKRKRQVLDSEGEPCVKAELTEDGSTLLLSGMTQSSYFDESGEWVEYSRLVGINEEGDEATLHKSTLGNAQELTVATPEALSQNETLSVYAVEEAEVDEQLMSELAKGEIFSFPFSYRSDYSLETAFLLANDKGVFVIVTRDTEPLWCELKTTLVDTFDEEDIVDDDLDFEMF